MLVGSRMLSATRPEVERVYDDEEASFVATMRRSNDLGDRKDTPLLALRLMVCNLLALVLYTLEDAWLFSVDLP